MAERRGQRPGTGAAGRPAEDDAAAIALVERALTALEELVQSGRAADIPRWTAVLWHHRAETEHVLLRRLASGTVRVPALFLEVLAGLGGTRAGRLMRQVADTPEVPDLVRLEARRRAGWPERARSRARVDFLRSLRDTGGALRAYAAMAATLPVPDGEISGEILGYLQALPGDQRLAMVARLAAELGPGVSWLLRALLSVPDGVTRELAASELLEMRDRGAATALHRLARSAASDTLRATAEVATRRLSLRVIDGGAGRPARRTSGGYDAEAMAGGPAPAFELALITAVDGHGGQSVAVIRAWDADARLVAHFALHEDGGIVSAGGAMRVPHEQAHKVLRRTGGRGCPLATVSLEEARAAVLWAVERALDAGRLPPPAFALWEPYLYEDLCPTVGPDALGDLALPAGGVPATSPAEEALLHSPFCAEWQFSADRLAGALHEAADAEAQTAAGGSPRYAAVLNAVCPPEDRAMWARRLQRQAWVLERCGRPDLRDAALGCAARLEGAAPEDLADLPLMRGMLARGLTAIRRSGGRGPETRSGQ